MVNFSLRSLIFSKVQHKVDNFSLPKSLFAKLVMPAFGQGTFVRVYARVGKLDKSSLKVIFSFIRMVLFEIAEK